MTLTILALIGALSFASFGQQGPALARAEAAQVALVLQRARLEAAERGQAVEVRWEARAQTLHAGSSQHALRRGVTGPGQPFAITLQPTGQSEGLRLPLEAAGFAVEVTLDWLTGRVAQRS